MATLVATADPAAIVNPRSLAMPSCRWIAKAIPTSTRSAPDGTVTLIAHRRDGHRRGRDDEAIDGGELAGGRHGFPFLEVLWWRRPVRCCRCLASRSGTERLVRREVGLALRVRRWSAIQ